ncbi:MULTISPECIES: AMP-binding protein [Acinetobacter]|jgi:long-subunit acyl-CoA synthetase (AMP-forming)/3-hydroxymyristoyl/3-hydroxydecanoyl-(acyl carrier protein) dehydratase|uniref:Long-chain-fatty-acid--CoA ligase n=1 Tax=Acinetobacter pittii TaxID=48296 RepID=A0A242U0C2_ACIPI|nr:MULTISPECIES: AMP-binding protein [Acinetobacter]EXS23865.1 AMP-binding enzyme family protein [Acinetobacter baumannii 573719]MBJ8469952.1 AMP-binding protein [Acinetobacter pittii]MBJ8502352.1 AMP-binding protein [Acinetobacter pittii]MBJ9892784.1 AMP-binding protein [Acinetobacter pittii]MCU4478937.1 AMP-binding protein [Acinetobacter sp. WU_MDCI_Abxd143]
MYCHFQKFIDSAQSLCIDGTLNSTSFNQFWQDVALQAAAIAQMENLTWALWEADSYEFLVLFFAALLAKKQILLPPNRLRELEQDFAAQQIYFLKRQEIGEVVPLSLMLDDAFLEQAQLYFYTSGSTGEPRKIPRTLRQLLNEVQGLSQSFSFDEHATAIATVSHQHIYGLLFKLLLPLATGRSFYNPQMAFPEDVVQAQKQLETMGLSNYLISSPALLKRWTTDVVLQHCQMVFSSGGKLESGVRPLLNRPIIEVLGSSETGGIAHRAKDEDAWTTFSNVAIRIEDQQLMVKSNHAFENSWITTGDGAVWTDTTCQIFKLMGRTDRIVKLEEKRLSLDAIEQTIQALDAVKQCHVLVFEHEQRQMLGCIIVLTEQAREQLQQQGKSAFVNHLKQQLKDGLETIAIPRQWRFLSQLPQNTQSKLNKNYLKTLFKPMLQPVVLSQSQNSDDYIWELEFPPELACFKGHFPTQPIYPGVGQIGFLQHFAKSIWSDLSWCQGYEQLKFQNLIRPYAVVQLKLARKEHKVSFELRDSEQILASGRLLFALQMEVED